MTGFVLGLALLFGPLGLLAAVGYGWRHLRPHLAAIWYGLFRDPDTYPPEAAQVPDQAEIDQLNALYALPAYIKEQSNG